MPIVYLCFKAAEPLTISSHFSPVEMFQATSSVVCNSKGKNSSKAFALPVEPATSDWAEADMKTKRAEIMCARELGRRVVQDRLKLFH